MAVDAAPARLRIHAAPATGPRWWLRWRARWPSAGRPARLAAVRIVDLQGRPVFAADDVPAPLQLQLPAGTYDISVCHAGHSRRYTAVLLPGTGFELQLPAARPTNFKQTPPANPTR